MLPLALGILSPRVAVDVTGIDLEDPHYIKNLRYVESSNGLEVPHLESGRTEIELGDANGDGCVDILSIGDHGSPYVNTDEHGIMVWFGNGRGSWSVYQNGNFGYGGIALGDADGDGLMDVGYGMHHNYSGVDFGDSSSRWPWATGQG